MTPEQTIKITAMVMALCPQQKFEEYTPDAWHLVLGDLDFSDTRDAVIVVCKRSPFCAPSEIRDQVRLMRDDRLRAAGQAALDVDVDDPDDVAAYLGARREHIRRLAGGGSVPVRDETTLARRPVEELLDVAGEAWSMPDGPDPDA